MKVRQQHMLLNYEYSTILILYCPIFMLNVCGHVDGTQVFI